MTDPQEEALRRLLAEAVQPVQPAPGAEARLHARIRARASEQRDARRRRTRLLGRGAAAVGSLAAVVVAVVLVVQGVGDRGSSSDSSAGGAADAGSAPAAAPSAPVADASSSAASLASPASRLVFSAGPVPTLSLPGVAGSPSVRLPPTGAGARLLGVVQLPQVAGAASVSVAAVRLETVAGASRDVLVAVRDDRLALLTVDGRPLVLRVDVTHGYGCGATGLALHGQGAPYVVDGDTLVRSPQLVAVQTPAGRGCLP